MRGRRSTPEQQSHVRWLYFTRDFSMAEVAERVGLSKSTVYRIVNRLMSYDGVPRKLGRPPNTYLDGFK